MRILTVPNWSFGRSSALLRQFGEILGAHEVTVHYLASDIDHNRTVSAFSGEPEPVESALRALARAAFDAIDLNHHVGVHPRIGALDVCPFVPLGDEPLVEYLAFAEATAAHLARDFDIPVFLYEKSERGRHEADLPSLRRGGFGGMLDQELHPDFGPHRVHPRLGATILGVRDFLIALNVDLRHPMATVARQIASEIRTARTEGDTRFLGVRALGMTLPSREMSQVSMNLTLPELTPLDDIVDHVEKRALELGVAPGGVELIGVIGRRHLEHATRVPFRPSQIVEI